jgi:phosphoribosylformimino-5-aminoimidazole carboxamide ribotide isomerase
MKTIGVIDLRGGVAVHARGGTRREYTPIGDAVDLARAYVERGGVGDIYVADLDAIDGAPDLASSTVRAVAAIGAPVWLDAGITSVERARAALDAGASRVVVGLETLTSFEALRAICDAAGSERVAFSLDLRDGAPLGIGRGEDACALVDRAAAAGAGAVIVLDLARVGMRTGLDLDLLRRVRAVAPDVELIAGGGVRGDGDLKALEEAGCQGALVGTMLVSHM